MQLDDCHNVADLIDLLCEVREESHPRNYNTLDPLKREQVKRLNDSYQRQAEVESHIQTALLAYGGPAVWRGRLWWTHERPRDGVINDVPVYSALSLPWPVKVKARDVSDTSSTDRKFEKECPPTTDLDGKPLANSKGEVFNPIPVIPTVWGEVPPEECEALANKVWGPFKVRGEFDISEESAPSPPEKIAGPFPEHKE